jgi:hypothetical protein
MIEFAGVIVSARSHCERCKGEVMPPVRFEIAAPSLQDGLAMTLDWLPPLAAVVPFAMTERMGVDNII